MDVRISLLTLNQTLIHKNNHHVHHKDRRGDYFAWSQQGMILRPPDYESGATNQLSYGTLFLLSFERLPRWASYRRAVITTSRVGLIRHNKIKELKNLQSRRLE